MKKIPVSTKSHEEIIDITHVIQDAVGQNGIENGFIFIHVPHTTAGITVNENADPDVKDDILLGLKRFDDQDYRHGEGNSPAHIKSSLMGCNLTLKVENGRLCLGTWQGIMFCEFDGPRNRNIWFDLM